MPTNTNNYFDIIERGDYSKFEKALEKIKDINEVYQCDWGPGQTLLCAAVTVGKKKIVQLLLSRGADPNIPNEDYCVPLMITKNHEIAKLLFKNKANPNLRIIIPEFGPTSPFSSLLSASLHFQNVDRHNKMIQMYVENNGDLRLALHLLLERIQFAKSRHKPGCSTFSIDLEKSKFNDAVCAIQTSILDKPFIEGILYEFDLKRLSLVQYDDRS